MTKYLTPDEIISIHDHYVQKFGGSLGIRDDHLLDSAVHRCQATFDGQDLYKTIYDKAAALLHGLILDHAFVDGNKRVGLMSAIAFLKRNNYIFAATDKEIIAFPLWVQKDHPPVSAISSWLKSHSKKRK